MIITITVDKTVLAKDVYTATTFPKIIKLMYVSINNNTIQIELPDAYGCWKAHFLSSLFEQNASEQ